MKKEKKKKPLSSLSSIDAPHTPWLPSHSFQAKSEAGKYGDFVTQVDYTVGQVMQALDQAGKSENTLVIVTSDNGSNWTFEDKQNFKHRANYSEDKKLIYMRGHRIPCIAKWPIKLSLVQNQTK